MKSCSRCGIEKELECFRLRHDKRGSGGKTLIYPNNTCKKCDSEISTETYFKKKGDSGFIEQWRKKSRDYHNENREMIKVKSKNYRQSSEYKAMMKAYRLRNKNKIREQELVTKKRYHIKNMMPLTDKYIIDKIAALVDMDKKEIRKYPELIEAKRLQILIKRKTQNNAN